MKTPPATMNATTYLRRALQLLEAPRRDQQGNITHPNSWIRNAEAILANGQHCEPEDERAVGWCTIGVVKAVTKYDDNPEPAYRYVCSLLDASPIVIAHDSLPSSNDSAETFERVRKTFLRAIALAEKLGLK